MSRPPRKFASMQTLDEFVDPDLMRMTVDVMPHVLRGLGVRENDQTMASAWSKDPPGAATRLSGLSGTREDYAEYVSKALTSHLLYPNRAEYERRLEWARRKWEASACRPRKHPRP